MYKPKLIVDITPEMMDDPEVRKMLRESAEKRVKAGETNIGSHEEDVDPDAYGAKDENGKLRLPR